MTTATDPNTNVVADDEDPWGDATALRFTSNEPNGRHLDADPLLDDDDFVGGGRGGVFSMRARKRFVYFSVGLDMLVGTLGWTSLVVQQVFFKDWRRDVENGLPSWLFIVPPLVAVWSTILLLRAVLALCGIKMECCQRGGLSWSAKISVFIILVEAVAAVVAGIEHRALHKWCQKFFPVWLPAILMRKAALSICSFVCICILCECLRYRALHKYRKILLRADRIVLLRVSPELILSESGHRRGRPWWWSSHASSHFQDVSNDTAHQEPLLAAASGPEWATGADTYSPPARPPPRRFFDVFRRRNVDPDGHNSDLRQQGSADFASVHEEWASRDEEDPQWWSREGNSPNRSNKDKADACGHHPPDWIEATTPAVDATSIGNSQDALTVASETSGRRGT